MPLNTNLLENWVAVNKYIFLKLNKEKQILSSFFFFFFSFYTYLKKKKVVAPGWESSRPRKTVKDRVIVGVLVQDAPFIRRETKSSNLKLKQTNCAAFMPCTYIPRHFHKQQQLYISPTFVSIPFSPPSSSSFNLFSFPFWKHNYFPPPWTTSLAQNWVTGKKIQI